MIKEKTRKMIAITVVSVMAMGSLFGIIVSFY
jgi:hypothetical protein